jgi:hypothetical protein
MKDVYTEGYNAALDNQPMWGNPYTDGNSLINDSQVWFAGWCYGKRYLEGLNNNGEPLEL